MVVEIGVDGIGNDEEFLVVACQFLVAISAC